MFDLGVHKTDFLRLITETEALELVSGKLFKPAVEENGSFFGGQNTLSIFDDKWRILDRHALGQIGIVSENAAAVADGEDNGDQIQVIAFAGLLHLFQAAEESGGFLGKRIQAGGKHRAIATMLSGGIQNADDLRHIAVRFQVPPEDPDKAISQWSRAPKRKRQGQQERK
jgi:hypothetical protein